MKRSKNINGGRIYLLNDISNDRMLKYIDHIDLMVRDIHEATSFFVSLGFEIIRKTSEPRSSVELKLPGENQVVFEIKPSKDGKVGLNHIAFKQVDDVSQIRIQELGIDISEPKLIPDTGRSVCNFQDPSGNKWQLTD